MSSNILYIVIRNIHHLYSLVYIYFVSIWLFLKWINKYYMLEFAVLSDIFKSFVGHRTTWSNDFKRYYMLPAIMFWLTWVGRNPKFKLHDYVLHTFIIMCVDFPSYTFHFSFDALDYIYGPIIPQRLRDHRRVPFVTPAWRGQRRSDCV